MPARLLNITVEQGVDFDEEYDLPAEYDLNGADAAMQFRAAIGYPTALITLTTRNGGLAIDATRRKLRIAIAGAVTKALDLGDYVHDVKLREASGKIRRPYYGSATVVPEVTVYDFVQAHRPSLTLGPQGGYLLLRSGGRILLGP